MASSATSFLSSVELQRLPDDVLMEIGRCLTLPPVFQHVAVPSSLALLTLYHLSRTSKRLHKVLWKDATDETWTNVVRQSGVGMVSGAGSKVLAGIIAEHESACRDEVCAQSRQNMAVKLKTTKYVVDLRAEQAMGELEAPFEFKDSPFHVLSPEEIANVSIPVNLNAFRDPSTEIPATPCSQIMEPLLTWPPISFVNVKIVYDPRLDAIGFPSTFIVENEQGITIEDFEVQFREFQLKQLQPRLMTHAHTLRPQNIHWTPRHKTEDEFQMQRQVGSISAVSD
ncbi:hypothetical protein P7C73_g3714, partial [Tremellales sp. Uapishka_1]